MRKYEQFIKKLSKEVWPNKEPYIRKGQALMNFLWEFDPEEYKRLSSIHYYDETDIDCFYRDELISNTLEHLKEVWK